MDFLYQFTPSSFVKILDIKFIMKKIVLVIIFLFSLLTVAFSQKSVNINDNTHTGTNLKKEQKKVKKEYRTSKKEFFDNFYNPVLYEDVGKVIVKDTVIRTTFYVYDITNDDYLADGNLTINEKESIHKIANMLNNNKIFFDKNSSFPKIEQEDFIVEVAKILQTNPTLNLMIESYTCEFDTEKQNRDFAMQRARAVSNLFILKGINFSRLKAVGFTVSDPQNQYNNSEEYCAVTYKIFKKN